MLRRRLLSTLFRVRPLPITSTPCASAATASPMAGSTGQTEPGGQQTTLCRASGTAGAGDEGGHDTTSPLKSVHPLHQSHINTIATNISSPTSDKGSRSGPAAVENPVESTLFASLISRFSVSRWSGRVGDWSGVGMG